MILQKVVAAGRSAAVRHVVSPNYDVMAIARRNKVVATPPRQAVSLGEKAFLSALVTCGVVAGPVWVIAHIREYGAAAE